MSGALEGKVALVTGASSGIGAETAIAFAAEGAQVVLTGRDGDRLSITQSTIESRGGRVSTLVGDVTDPKFCDALVAHAEGTAGGLDVLANVAGTITRGTAMETSDSDWRKTMAVNVDAVFFLSRAAIPVLRHRGGGTIVNLASNVGLVGSAGLLAYCVSKGAVVQLTKAMALDHAAEGIRVNALCPGAVDTPMLASGHGRTGLTPDDVLARNVAAIPEGRIPSPAEVARSMVYLASDRSSHVNGVALPIDGGYVAR